MIIRFYRPDGLFVSQRKLIDVATNIDSYVQRFQCGEYARIGTDKGKRLDFDKLSQLAQLATPARAVRA